jgi:hypothetical protein
MKTIWKFELDFNSTFEMPKGAEILTVQLQKDIPCLWALVDTEKELEKRHFETYGTGHPLSYERGNSKVYIGTYQIANGALVFHVFEMI